MAPPIATRRRRRNDVIDQFQAMLARGHYPALQGLMGYFTDWVDDNEMSGQVFRFGLEALLDGAALRIAQAAAETGWRRARRVGCGRAERRR